MKVLGGGDAAPEREGVVRALTLINPQKKSFGAWVLKGNRLDASAMAAAPAEPPPAVKPGRDETMQARRGGMGMQGMPFGSRQGANSQGAEEGEMSEGEKLLSRRFKRFDKNGDGSISLSELASAAPGKEKKFSRLDQNGDGKITKKDRGCPR